MGNELTALEEGEKSLFRKRILQRINSFAKPRLLSVANLIFKTRTASSSPQGGAASSAGAGGSALAPQAEAAPGSAQAGFPAAGAPGSPPTSLGPLGFRRSRPSPHALPGLSPHSVPSRHHPLLAISSPQFAPERLLPSQPRAQGRLRSQFRITAFSPHHFSSSPFISHSLPLPSVPPQGFPSPPSLLSFSLTDFCLSFKTNGTLWGSRSLTDLSIPAHCPQASLSDIL